MPARLQSEQLQTALQTRSFTGKSSAVHHDFRNAGIVAVQILELVPYLYEFRAKLLESAKYGVTRSWGPWHPVHYTTITSPNVCRIPRSG